MSGTGLRTGREAFASSRPALIAFLAAIGLCVLLGLLYLAGVVSDERLIFSAAFIAVACLFTLVAGVVADLGRFRAWMRSGVVAGWAATLAWVLFLWSIRSMQGYETAFRVLGCVSLYATWTVLGGVTLMPRSRGTAVLFARWAAFGLLSWWAAFAAASIAVEGLADRVVEAVGPDNFGRCLAASAILAAAGFVAQPVLIRLGRVTSGRVEGAVRGRRTRVPLGCPRCGHACEVEANVDARCDACRLELRVEFEEPRCACGYLLHGLAAPSCPECGAAVPEDRRWRAAAEPGVTP